MKHGSIGAAGCAVLIALTAGCSAGDEAPTETSAPPDQASVMFGGNDAGATRAVNCTTANGRTTISIEADQSTTILLTDEPTPVVKSVGIGKVGSDSPALVYAEGITGTPAVATRDGKQFTISGSGMGTNPANPVVPIETPFEIKVTCP